MCMCVGVCVCLCVLVSRTNRSEESQDTSPNPPTHPSPSPARSATTAFVSKGKEQNRGEARVTKYLACIPTIPRISPINTGNAVRNRQTSFGRSS